MSLLEYLADEKYKLLANAVVAAVGFFIALFANRRVDEWKERQAFAATLDAVKSETRSNDIILRESFLPMYKDGLVLREFSIVAVSQALTNPLFVKHATANQLETLGRYLRHVSLSNAYRAKAETIRFSDSYFKKQADQSIKYWEPMLVKSWQGNLTDCEKSISAVQSIT